MSASITTSGPNLADRLLSAKAAQASNATVAGDPATSTLASPADAIAGNGLSNGQSGRSAPSGGRPNGAAINQGRKFTAGLSASKDAAAQAGKSQDATAESAAGSSSTAFALLISQMLGTAATADTGQSPAAATGLSSAGGKEVVTADGTASSVAASSGQVAPALAEGLATAPNPVECGVVAAALPNQDVAAASTAVLSPASGTADDATQLTSNNPLGQAQMLTGPAGAAALNGASWQGLEATRHLPGGAAQPAVPAAQDPAPSPQQDSALASLADASPASAATATVTAAQLQLNSADLSGHSPSPAASAPAGAGSLNSTAVQDAATPGIEKTSLWGNVAGQDSAAQGAGAAAQSAQGDFAPASVSPSLQALRSAYGASASVAGKDDDGLEGSPGSAGTAVQKALHSMTQNSAADAGAPSTGAMASAASAGGVPQTSAAASGNSSAASTGQPAPIADQIASAMPAGLKDGQQIVIHLNPPDLGDIHVTVRGDSDGVRCTLAVDNPATLDQIQREAPALMHRLAEGGVSVKNMDLTLRETGGSTSSYGSPQDGGAFRQSQGQGQWQNSQQSPGSETWAGDSPVPAAATAASDAGGATDGNTVNIWI